VRTAKAALTALLTLLAVGCTSDKIPSHELTEHLVLKQVLLASNSSANLPLIVSAGNKHDLDALDAMEADGRLVLLPPETVIECHHDSTTDPRAIEAASVLSGKLIGRQFYVYRDAADFSKDTVDTAIKKYAPKTNDEMWIRMGGGLIELEKQAREIERLQERAKKVLPK
jgi:hypothetical protein